MDPLPTYWNGGALGIRYQLDSGLRLARHPADFFLLRPGIALSHQTVLVNLLHGTSAITDYMIPLIAMVIVLGGMLIYHRVVRRRYLPLFAATIVVYMVGWFCFLLIV